VAKPSYTNFVAPHGSTEHVLNNGSVAIPGEEITLDEEAMADPHNKRLIDEGQILEVAQSGSPKKKEGE
jgi:hypothetical protein